MTVLPLEREGGGGGGREVANDDKNKGSKVRISPSPHLPNHPTYIVQEQVVVRATITYPLPQKSEHLISVVSMGHWSLLFPGNQLTQANYHSPIIRASN